MTVDIEELDASGEGAWEAFVAGVGGRFAYPSLRYRRFLCELLPDGTPRYLVARRDGEIVGVLPAFVDRSELATVVTALPFHCSNGGAVAAGDDPEVVAVLLDGFRAVAAEEGAATSSIVTNPFGTSDAVHRDLFPHDHADPRAGQWTELPAPAGDDPAVMLWEALHGKTRNAVRKAERSGVAVRPATSDDDWRAFHALHGSNMARLGAAPKSPRTIAVLRSTFNEPGALDLWIGHVDGTVVAAVLTVAALDTVEYFVPAFDEGRKDLQALSLTVWHSLRHSVERGMRTYNWGGTRPGQEGVHRFKSRWSGTEAPYSVLTAVHDRRILERSAAELSAAHPHSYVAPFALLGG